MALQTKTFTKGSTTSAQLHFYSLVLTLTEQSVNPADNTSRILYKLTLNSGNTSFIGFGTGRELRLAGKQVAYVPRSSESEITIGRNSTVVLLEGSTDVTHGVDGTLDMSVAFSIDQAAMSFTPGPVSVTGLSMPLTGIARASGIGATDADIESVSTISISKKNPAYTSSIAYSFGALSGYLTDGGAVSDTEARFSASGVGFLIPASFYSQIPDAPSGKCTLTCRTYSGSAQIGAAQSCEFTVTAARSRCAPLLSAAVVDGNADTKALTGDENILIRYQSTALCTLTAQARNGASLVYKTIAGTAVEGNTLSIPQTSQNSFLFAVTDSRGYSERLSVTKDMVDYIPLTCKPDVRRDSPTANTALLLARGKYFSGSFGAESNTLKVTYRTKAAGGSYGTPVQIPATFPEDGWLAEVTVPDLAYNTAWTVEVTAEDALSCVVAEVSVPKGVPVFDWGEEDFNINGTLKLSGQAMGDFVTAQGESGFWRYRKWASGIVECWGNTTVSVTGSTAAGSLYYSNIVNMDTPIPFTPLVITGNAQNLHWIANANGTAGHIYFRLMRATGVQSAVDISLYVIGKGT